MPAEPSLGYSHIHDPFKPPSGLLHFKLTILWRVLTEILIFSVFAVLVVVLSDSFYQLTIAPTLLTLYGTVIGLLLTFKTNAAFGSYQEGRRLWSSVILASRSFARYAWLHCPDYTKVPEEGEVVGDDEKRKGLLEKKTYINLVAAFAIALKHYVRGEAGINYVDLYPLVCFLPRFRRPTLDSTLDSSSAYDYSTLNTFSSYSTQSSLSFSRTLSSQSYASSSDSYSSAPMLGGSGGVSSSSGMTTPQGWTSKDDPGLKELDLADVVEKLRYGESHARNRSGGGGGGGGGAGAWTVVGVDAATGMEYTRIVPPLKLLPARNPPPRSIDDFIPFFDFFADLLTYLTRRTAKVADNLKARGKEPDSSESRRRRRGNRKKRPLQAQKQGDNVPLEIISLLSAWVAALQRRKTADVATISQLLAAVQSLSEALSGLEQVLLTPMPISYSLHLRHVIWLFLLLLPSQLHDSLGWLTVPAVAVATFVYLGLLRLGDEIENPLGYDESDLPLESFVNTVLKELRELCAHPPAESDPEAVVFVEDNLPFATGPTYASLSATQIVEKQVPLAELQAKLREAGARKTEAVRDVEIAVGGARVGEGGVQRV
ncbi:hypothetical protein JCM10213_005246 [Rhodosporidiobolus nylandii]